MTDDWRDEVFKQFPGFFERGADITCCEGWKNIICETITKLRNVDPKISCYYIEDDWGAIRFHIGNAIRKNDDEIAEILLDAQHLCQDICERCGEKGTLRIADKFCGEVGIVLCDNCWKKFYD